MIGNTIETDLVGELIELWFPGRDDRLPRRCGRGRCRAITCDGHGAMYVWIEMLDDECVAASTGPWTMRPQIGDVIRWGLDEGYGTAAIRLIKEQR